MNPTRFALLCAATLCTNSLFALNIALMKDEPDQINQMAPVLSIDEKRLQAIVLRLAVLQKYTDSYNEATQTNDSYELCLKELETVAQTTKEESVLAKAHFTLGTYAYHGYFPSVHGTRKGVSFKKALHHFKNTTEFTTTKQIVTASNMYAQAYFLMGMIYAQGESCFFGCMRTLPIDAHAAEASFILAQAYAEHGSDIATKAAHELAKLTVEDEEKY